MWLSIRLLMQQHCHSTLRLNHLAEQKLWEPGSWSVQLFREIRVIS